MIAKEKLPKHLLQVMYLTFGVQGRASPHHGAQRLLDSRLSGGLTPNSCQERISSGLGVLRTTLPQDISSLFSGHPLLLVSQSRRCVPSTLDSRGSRVVSQAGPRLACGATWRQALCLNTQGHSFGLASRSLPYCVRSQAGRWQVLDSGPTLFLTRF